MPSLRDLLFRTLLAICWFALSLGRTPVCTAADAEWNRFRGPNGSGCADSLFPATWTDADYRWRAELPGTGHSSPVATADRVFVTSADEASAAQHALCLRAEDGAILWRRDFASAPQSKHTMNAYATATPSLSDGRLFVVWAEPTAYHAVALDTADGHTLWEHVLGPFAAQHGFGASPIVWRDLVILPNDQEGKSSLVALDVRTGVPRWQLERRSAKAAYSTPCLWSLPTSDNLAQVSPQLIFTSQAQGVSALDPSDGRQLWELPALHERPVGSPVAAGRYLIATGGDGGGGKQCLVIEPGDAAATQPPKVLYEAKGTLPYVPTPLVVDGRLYLWAESGAVSCLKLETGELLWRERTSGKYFASPVCSGGKIYGIARDGKVTILAAGDRFELLGKADLGEASQATPAICGGTMFLRGAAHLMALPALRP